MANLIAFIFGALIGVKLPDIDLAIPFLQHRSIITHNFIWPVLILGIVKMRRGNIKDIGRLFALGMSTTLAIHFAYDLFPRAWKGFALIHIPIFGRTGEIFSWLWIALSLFVCVYLAVSLIHSLTDMVFVIISATVLFTLMATREPFIWPLISLSLTFIVVTLVDWQKMLRLKNGVLRDDKLQLKK